MKKDKEDKKQQLENDKTNDNTFGIYIRNLRIKNNLTLAQVSKMLNVSINYISQMERGERKATEQFISEFSKLYQVNEDLLFRKAGRIPIDVMEELRDNITLQRAIAFIKRRNISESKRNKIRDEIINVFAESFNLHRDDVLNEFSKDEKNNEVKQNKIDDQS